MIVMATSPTLAVTNNVPAEFGSIQVGLNASAPGDTVLVQPGTYFENIVWPQVSGIKLIAAGDTSDTFIDASQDGRVITITSEGLIDTTTLIQGFTIRNGSIDDDGGGIYCYLSSPTISNCAITGNSAYSGGGIYCSLSSSPSISNSIISENSTAEYGSGGGIYCFQSNPTISNCMINDNTVGLHANGGGTYCYHSNPTIINSSISGNSASRGGGIYAGGSSLSISHCVITGNTTTSGGGGIYYTASNDTISNCTISGNSAGNGIGGGIKCTSFSGPTIINCTITDNIGDGIRVGTSLPRIKYCDFYNNSGGNFNGVTINPDLGVIVGINANNDSCDVFYNICLDPMYIDMDNGDFHLQEGSPCIDVGNPISPLDPDDTITDMGAFYYHHTNPLLVEVTLSPTSPTVIPAEGGAISFDANVVSHMPGNYPNMWFWTKVRMPDGNFYPDVQFQTMFTLIPYMDATGSITQEIPTFAPAGDYQVWGWIGFHQLWGPNSGNYFSFTKSAVVTGGSDVNDWSSNGYMIAGGEESINVLPTSYEMKSAYPNPFNPTTTINVSLPQSANLNVSVFNIAGQQVGTLASGTYSAGSHTLTFDASNLASGLYFIHAHVPGHLNQTQKVMLVR